MTISKRPIRAFSLPEISGEVHNPSIAAAATLTLALPKTGLIASGIRDQIGELYLSDISVPGELYEELSLQVPSTLFALSDVVRLETDFGG